MRFYLTPPPQQAYRMLRGDSGAVLDLVAAARSTCGNSLTGIGLSYMRQQRELSHFH